MEEKCHYIKRIFNESDAQKTGIYGVYLCVDGEFQMVVVDDMIPCLGEDQGPSFSKANGDELWVLLLEKAYAKIYGTYEKINNGMSGKAINDLTGAPYENLDINSRTALKGWGMI